MSDQIKPIKDTRQFRSLEIREYTDEAGTVTKRGILATENPVPMVDWERLEIVPEILCIDGCKTRGTDLKLVDSHGTNSVRNVLGSFKDIRRNLPATKDTPFQHMDGVVDISKAEPDIRTKYEEGHIDEMSVGYSFDPTKSRYVPEGETFSHNGRTFSGPVNVRMVWTATEASLVTLGADEQAQIRGYSSLDEALAKKVEPEAKYTQTDDIRTITNDSDPVEAQTIPMETPTQTQDKPVTAAVVAEDTGTRTDNTAAMQSNNERCATISDLGNTFNVREEASKAISSGMTTEEFISSVRSNMTAPQPVAADPIGWSQKEAKTYSLARALKCLSEGKEVDGLEGEVSREVAKRSGKIAASGGLFLPNNQDMMQFVGERASLAAGTASVGGAFVPTQVADDFVPMFSPNPVMLQLGAGMITDMDGPFNLPAGLVNPVASTKAENVAHSESNPTFAELAYAPNAYGFFTEVSKRLLHSANQSIEARLRQQMSDAVAQAMDADGFNGTGSDECDGIYGATGVSAIPITVAGQPSYAELLEFEEFVETGNALEGNLSYVVSPGVKSFLKRTPIYGTDSAAIWNNNEVNGYNAISTNQLPDNASTVFGDFSHYSFAMFDGVEITVTEDATLAKKRAVQFTINVDLDGRVTQGGAFATNA